MAIPVLDTIYRINPWFTTSAVSDRQLQPFKRREFEMLFSDLHNLDLASLIIGGRRVGKSVLMYQLIHELIQGGTEPNSILFIQGDNPILREEIPSGNIITVVLDTYQRYILRQKFSEANDTVYIFIDEAQSLEKWDEHLKSLIDLKDNVKYVVTGSSSLALRKGAQNPLTGRVNIFFIPPFGFSDYARYKVSDQHHDAFTDELHKLQEVFIEGLYTSTSIDTLYNVAKKTDKLISQYNLISRFDEYLYRGGFPKIVSGDEENDMPKYLRDLLTTTIAKDLAANIRDTQAFERLLVILCLSIGGPIGYKAISDKLGIDDRSVSRYVDYYIETHWAYLSSQFRFHKKADSVKNNKKIYINDPGVINTLTFKDVSDITEDTDYRGCLVENVIHNHLYHFKQQKSGTFQNYVPFWVDSESKKEIDFIFEVKKGLIPIEVKTMNQISKSKLATIIKFTQDKKSAQFGIVTTEDRLEIKDNILYIPYRTLTLLL